MIVDKLGVFTILKDGSYYRVFQGRNRIASFYFLKHATDFIKKRHETGVARSDIV